MNKNKNYIENIETRKIRFADLAYYILLRWRIVILVTFFMSLLFSGLNVVKEKKAKTINLKEQKIVLSKDEIEGVRSIKECEKQLQSLKKYKDSSILMKIDAHAKYVITLQYYIDVSYDALNGMSSIYQAFVTGGELIDRISSQFNIERKLLSELIYFESYDNSTVKNEKTFSIKITHYNEGKCNELSRLINKEINNYKPAELKNKLRYQLIPILKSNTIEVDEALQQKQNQLSAEIESKQALLDKLQSSLTSSQKLYLEKEIGGNSKLTTQPRSIIKLYLKYLVIGCVFGVFVSSIFIMFKFIRDNSIKSEKEVKEIFGIKTYGTLFIDNKKNKNAFGLIDTLCKNFKMRRQRKVGNIDNQICKMSSEIELDCMADGIDTIILFSQHETEKTQLVVKKFNSYLQRKNISVFFNNEQDITKMEQCSEMNGDRIIMVISVGESFYNDIAFTLRKLQVFGKEVFGMIVLD